MYTNTTSKHKIDLQDKEITAIKINTKVILKTG